ncbi:MAG TPA: hypothetical protein PKW63_00685 [Vicinamibacterales bacterium]|jgi:hypothetical protein|nr:hypothetical protein [Vicinamibacterales bacterium]
MNEAELRSLVRTAVARHLGHAPPAMPTAAPVPSAPLTLLSSHAVYAGLVNVTEDCLIEPAVKCDHCGYCKSHGH